MQKEERSNKRLLEGRNKFPNPGEYTFCYIWRFLEGGNEFLNLNTLTFF